MPLMGQPLPFTYQQAELPELMVKSDVVVLVNKLVAARLPVLSHQLKRSMIRENGSKDREIVDRSFDRSRSIDRSREKERKRER